MWKINERSIFVGYENAKNIKLISFLTRQIFWWRSHKKKVLSANIFWISFDIRSLCTKFEVNTITLSKVIKVLSCVFWHLSTLWAYSNRAKGQKKNDKVQFRFYVPQKDSNPKKFNLSKDIIYLNINEHLIYLFRLQGPQN